MRHPEAFPNPQAALDAYRALLLPRRIEERMLKLLRQNKLAKWFSGIGQEAVAVGATLAMRPDDPIFTMHRNLGVFTTRGVPYHPLFGQLFGKADGFTGGRERSFHFGIPDHHIIGMISHLGAMLPVADGYALAARLRGQDRVALSFSGEGGTSEGDFHEAVNLAAVWRLPVIFLIENNGYGLSTPSRDQFVCERLADKGIGYGIPAHRIDGNDLSEVLATLREARTTAATGTPVLIEAMTFRMRGHEEASGTAYVPKELFEEWSRKDPILRMESYLKEAGWATEDDFKRMRAAADAEFSPAIDSALVAPEPRPEAHLAIDRVYAPTRPADASEPVVASEGRFIDGIRNTLMLNFDADPDRLVIGQDVAEYGGVFKVTEGFLDRYGRERVRNTPIIESGALGLAYGMALNGFKPVVEMQFADFISCGFNQIINNIAKSRYRWSSDVPMVIRSPHGAGAGAGPFHSQSPEGWFMQHAGLKVVVPGTVEDAQILLHSALHDGNPVLFFEHKRLYRSLKGSIFSQIPYEPLGKAKVLVPGSDVSVITYGAGVGWALDAAERMKAQGVSVEVVDLRTLRPLDHETIAATTKRTGRVLLLQEPSGFMGPLSEVAAFLAEECFSHLDAPVMRCSGLETPVPTHPALEQAWLPQGRLEAKLLELARY